MSDIRVRREVLLNAEPHRRHSPREGDGLIVEQADQALRRKIGSRVGEFGAHGRCCEGVPPGRSMKHGHDRQQVVAGMDRVVGKTADCVDVGGALRIGNALRMAGGAGRVAQHHRRSLVEHRPSSMWIDASDEIVVGNCVRERRVFRRRAHHHIAFDGLELVDERSQQRSKVGIDEQHLVSSMVYDVDQLIRKQPDVQCVAHGPGVSRCPVDLVVPEVVPGKRSDGVAPVHAKGLLEGGREATPRDHRFGRRWRGRGCGPTRPRRSPDRETV